MKKVQAIVCFFILCSFSFTGYAQEIKKALKTEDDGYSWYQTETDEFRGAQDLEGRDIVPLSKHFSLAYYDKGLFVAVTFKGDNICSCYYSKEGKELIAAEKYDQVIYMREAPSYFLVKKDGKEGAYDMNGKELVPLIYSRLMYGIDGFEAKITENDNYAPLNIKLPGHDDMAFVKKKPKSETNGFVWTELNAGFNRYGAMDKDNNVIIPLSRNYESIKFKPADNGRGIFEVRRDRNIGLCYYDGKEFLSPDKGYRNWRYMGGNFLCVDTNDEKYGVYDIDNGEIIRPGKYSYVSYNEEGFFEVKRGEYEGICNLQGREIIPTTMFTSVSHINLTDKPHWFSVKKDGKEGAYDETGKMLVPPQYSDLYYDKEEGFWYKDEQGNGIALNVRIHTLSTIEELFNQAYNTPDEEAQTKYDLYMQVVQADEGNANGYQAVAFNNIGVLYENLGDLTNARAYFEKSLAVCPSYELASSNLKRVKSELRSEKLNNIANAFGQIGATLGNMNNTQHGVSGLNSNSINSTSYSGNSSSSNSRGKRHCTNCAGSGDCPRCLGRGKVLGKFDQEFHCCPICNYNCSAPKEKRGKCTHCGGAGVR